MVKIRALESFSGAISMYKGEEREYSDKAVLSDLVKAKYVEEVTEKPNKEEELREEIESLRKELEDLKKVPINAGEDTQEPKQEDVTILVEEEPKKDVKSDEGKRNNK